jgi:hypothetical protein
MRAAHELLTCNASTAARVKVEGVKQYGRASVNASTALSGEDRKKLIVSAWFMVSLRVGVERIA